VELEARFKPSARLFLWACLHCALLQDCGIRESRWIAEVT